MTTRLHWGILGTGNIANQFAEGATHARRSKIVAVGSRTQRNASDFAERFEIAHAHGSYEALLADDGVEAVYISLPNSLHHEWTLKALAAGKHVLCEKPFASNEQQAREMFAAAERADRRLVEAFMYRSHPLTRAVIEKVRQGAIGNLKLVRTSFCYRTRHIEGNIRFDPALDGGALMDVGCYCLDFSCLLAGEAPESAEASAHIHPTGVDDYVAGSMKFPSGVLASFCCGMSVQTNNAAIISGDEGFIEIPVPWKPPVTGARYILARMTPPRQDRGSRRTPPPETIEVDAPLPLYGLEADDFARAVLDGAPPAVTPEQTLTTMRLLDELRGGMGNHEGTKKA